MKKIILSAVGICAAITLFAQNEVDALRYSLINPQGTARFNSMGGAFNSLGGDLTAIMQNPAGLAIYRKSEISLTPGLRNLNSTGSFGDRGFDNVNTDPVVSNAGFVWFSPSTSNNWKSFNIGLSYNRTNSFNQDYTSQGNVNLQNSLSQYFADEASFSNTPNSDIFDVYNFSSGLAWGAYVIDPAGGDSMRYQSGFHSPVIEQSNTFQSEGRMGETSLSLAGNYNDRFYIGGSIGFTSIYYDSRSTVREQPFNNPPADTSLASYSYTYSLLTEGSGVNIKLGAIYRATDALRVAAAIHTPTWYSLSDVYNASVSSVMNNGFDYRADSDRGFFDYRLVTPWKFLTGVSYIIGKKGLFSMDYEYTDYSQAKLKTTKTYGFNETFDAANNTIRKVYQSTHTIRAGGEIRFNEFAVRIGSAYVTTPFTNTSQGIEDYASLTLSGGAGYRGKHFYLDLAYSQRTYKYNYYFYSPAYSTPANLSAKDGMFSISLGYRFGE